MSSSELFQQQEKTIYFLFCINLIKSYNKKYFRKIKYSTHKTHCIPPHNQLKTRDLNPVFSVSSPFISADFPQFLSQTVPNRCPLPIMQKTNFYLSSTDEILSCPPDKKSIFFNTLGTVNSFSQICL